MKENIMSQTHIHAPRNIPTDSNNPKPWWKFGHVWLLLVAGPLTVVIASFITYYLAASGKDEIDENYYRKGIELSKKTATTAPTSMTPATQARNHATTGTVKVQQ